MSCNGNVYNIGMCCEPQVVLGPVENYYTKPTIDRKLEEITSAITSGCCITPEEVDEKIVEAISGITVSGVTEEQLNEAIASAKADIWVGDETAWGQISGSTTNGTIYLVY